MPTANGRTLSVMSDGGALARIERCIHVVNSSSKHHAAADICYGNSTTD